MPPGLLSIPPVVTGTNIKASASWIWTVILVTEELRNMQLLVISVKLESRAILCLSVVESGLESLL